jgi:hypothetical protein
MVFFHLYQPTLHAVRKSKVDGILARLAERLSKRSNALLIDILNIISSSGSEYVGYFVRTIVRMLDKEPSELIDERAKVLGLVPVYTCLNIAKLRAIAFLIDIKSASEPWQVEPTPRSPAEDTPIA